MRIEMRDQLLLSSVTGPSHETEEDRKGDGMKLEPEKIQPVLAKLRDGHEVRRQVDRLLLDVTARSPMTPKKLARLLRDFLRVGVDLADHQEAVQGLVLQTQLKKLRSVCKLSKWLLVALTANLGADGSEASSA